MRWARLLATALVGLSLAMAGGAMFLIVTELSWTQALVVLTGLSTLGVLTSVLGLVVTIRVPHNVTGPLLSTVGTLTAFFAGRDVYYRTWLQDPSSVPLDTRVVAFLDESAWWMFVAIALLLLFFPDGRLPSPRWRAVPYLIAGSALVLHLTGAWATVSFSPPMDEVPRPFGEYSLPVRIVSETAFGLVVLLGLACGVSLVLRFRRSAGAERAQLKWLSLAGAGLALYPVACGIELILTGGTDTFAAVIGVIALTALPLAVTQAMLRHRLYDVDRVIADTVSYAIVVVALVATYAVASLTLGVLVGQGSAVAAAGATAICALLLAPLRTRLRRAVDQRLFPPRRAALQAIDDLQRRIHTQGAQPEELEQVLRTALRDEHLRIGLLVPGEPGFADVRGVPVADTGLVPITLGDMQIGVVTASESTPPAVLRVVATASASLIEVTRLRAELAGALREVEASRTRLVQVGDAERKRLERDLHDGAQQRLVSLGMAMRLAQRHLPTGDVDVDGLLDQAVAELATAIAELRQIAHGLRPTSLDDGLHAALAALTSKLPIPVRLDVSPKELADDVATTAYFVAAEAITNAAKYARASEITVRVASAENGLQVRVEDDGVGGARARNGSGLSGLADRVAAIGGSLLMTSPVGSGTTVEAVLPCES